MCGSNENILINQMWYTFYFTFAYKKFKTWLKKKNQNVNYNGLGKNEEAPWIDFISTF